MTIHILKIISIHKSFDVKFRISKPKSIYTLSTAKEKTWKEKGSALNIEKNLNKTDFQTGFSAFTDANISKPSSNLHPETSRHHII